MTCCGFLRARSRRRVCGRMSLSGWATGGRGWGGCVPLFNLMEDAATAEISRAQLWQWIHHDAVMDDGLPVTVELVEEEISDELDRVRPIVDDKRYEAYERAAELMRELVQAPKFADFLTVPAYERVLESEKQQITV